MKRSHPMMWHEKMEEVRNSGPETNQSKGISWLEGSSWSPSPEAAAPLCGRSSWSPPTHSSRPCHSWSWLRCSTPSKWAGAQREGEIEREREKSLDDGRRECALCRRIERQREYCPRVSCETRSSSFTCGLQKCVSFKSLGVINFRVTRCYLVGSLRDSPRLKISHLNVLESLIHNVQFWWHIAMLPCTFLSKT